MAKKEATAFWVPPLFSDDGEQLSAGIGVDGKEYVDPLPLVLPIQELPHAQDLLANIRRVVEGEFLARKAAEEGFDTPEEADDFSDEDDYYELSDYQKALMEKDLNPAPSVSQESGKAEAVAGPPPQAVSRPGGEPGRESVVSSVVGKSDTEVKVKPEGS